MQPGLHFNDNEERLQWELNANGHWKLDNINETLVARIKQLSWANDRKHFDDVKRIAAEIQKHAEQLARKAKYMADGCPLKERPTETPRSKTPLK